MARLVLAAIALAAAAGTALAAKGTIDDMEHIVIFMQENRAFDHYYGKLNGVRGFNDRAAPPLPNGRPVFYQPVNPENTSKAQICGCAACELEWTPDAKLWRDQWQGLACIEIAVLVGALSPPVKVKEGEECSALWADLRNSSFGNIPFSSMLASATCTPDQKVTGLGKAMPPLEAPGGPGSVLSQRAARRAQGVAADGAADADAEGADDYILPFNVQFNKSMATCAPAPTMDYYHDIGIWNSGAMDAWNTARIPGFGMSYYDRNDLPFYYALADAFTVGDQYHQSTFTATNPNRQHLFTGSNGLSVNGSGFCQLDDSEPKPGFTWETMAETLMAADISWQVIQENDNFDDNAFEWFATFQNASKGSPLYEHGIRPVEDLVGAFADLVAADALPQVTWIVGPAALSEHAENHPADGEDLSARLIKVLADPANADVYAKTAFILNYDEGGQFVDHHWPPTPPISDTDGKSTVTTVGELTLKSEFGRPAGLPIGMGFRVPFFLVSPWTRGHYVYSEVADHTSVVKLIEQRFGVRCPNISPWRRAVAGDLTAAFNWSAPDLSWPTLPDTSANVNTSKLQCETLPPPMMPAAQSMPKQETGTRKARPLPYIFNVTASVSTMGRLELSIDNQGAAGAAFQAYHTLLPSASPQKYTVEAGKSLVAEPWPLLSPLVATATAGQYGLRLHGPNGFVRVFEGSDAAHTSGLEATLNYDTEGDAVVIAVAAPGGAQAGPCTFVITDNAYGAGGPWKVTAMGGAAPQLQRVSVADSGSWYDLSVTVSGADCPATKAAGGAFHRRFMGRMETGRETTSDPAMAAGKPGIVTPPHGAPRPVPEAVRPVERWTHAKECQTRRSMFKDHCWHTGEAAREVAARHASYEL